MRIVRLDIELPACSTFGFSTSRSGRCAVITADTLSQYPALAACGNQHVKGGSGTQRIEEMLRALLPQAKIARIERDSTRQRHAAKKALDAVHAGEVDVLVGTQMIAKGHDFQRVSLVVVLNPDGQLASHDFRAPERLFATLMQVSGRAGRAGLPSRVLVQTRFPGHPLFAALARHDYAQFAQAQLAERQAARMPPATYQALMTAEARTMEAALDFLRAARDQARNSSPWRRARAPVRSVPCRCSVGWRVSCAIMDRSRQVRIAHPAERLARSAARNRTHCDEYRSRSARTVVLRQPAVTPNGGPA